MRKILLSLALAVAALVPLAGTASAAPRPSTLGTRDVLVWNWSAARCGGLGTYHAGFTGLGYDSLLSPGRNALVAGFYSGGARVTVYQQDGSADGWRTVGTFGMGQHPFGPGVFGVVVHC